MNFTMDWDNEAKLLIGKTPAELIDVAITTIEEFARENGFEIITRAVLAEQMSSIGMDPGTFLK